MELIAFENSKSIVNPLKTILNGPIVDMKKSNYFIRLNNENYWNE